MGNSAPERRYAAHVEASGAGQSASLLGCFFHPATVAKAVKVALIVGPILGLINHFDLLADGRLTGVRLFKIGLTFLVPFCVSGYSSATTMRAEHSACRGDATQ